MIGISRVAIRSCQFGLITGQLSRRFKKSMRGRAACKEPSARVRQRCRCRPMTRPSGLSRASVARGRCRRLLKPFKGGAAPRPRQKQSAARRQRAPAQPPHNRRTTRGFSRCIEAPVDYAGIAT